MKNAVPKKFAIFTGKHLFLSCRPTCSFTKNRLQHRCFPVNTATFLRTSILENIYERLLLSIDSQIISVNQFLNGFIAFNELNLQNW